MSAQPNVIPDALYVPPYKTKLAPLLSPLKTDTARLIVDATISTPTLDRDDEIVDPMGFVLEYYAINAPVLFAHQLQRTPIATAKDPATGVLSVKCSTDRVTSKAFFSSSIADSEAFFRLVEEGLLVGTSIGFRTLQSERLSDEESQAIRAATYGLEQSLRNTWPVYRHKRIELTEWSLVPVGSNRYTVASVVASKSIGGYRLSDDAVRMLAPFAERAQAFSPGWSPAPSPTHGVPPVTPAASQSNGQTDTKGTSEATMSQATPAAAATGAGTVPAGTTATTSTQAAGTAAVAEAAKSPATAGNESGAVAGTNAALPVQTASPPVPPQTKAGMADESNGDDEQDADEPEMKAGERMMQCALAYKSTMVGEMAKLLKTQEDEKVIKFAHKCIKANMGLIEEGLSICGEKYPDTEFEMADLPEMEDEDDENEEDADESEEGDEEERSDDGDDDEKDEDEDDEKTWDEIAAVADRINAHR